AEAAAPSPALRGPGHRAELDPGQWWQAAAAALRRAVAGAGRPPRDYAGLTASSLRQGFVLTDGANEVGPGVLNSDRRGASHLDRLRRQVGAGALYALTGHWPAPELTLPKLLHLAERQPERWAATRQVLFVHDWALWRLCGRGRAATEASYACAGQLADVARRAWATDLLDELGIGTGRLAPLVEAGTVVGALQISDLGLPVGLPVVAGGGDTQLAAMGAGGLADGVVTVVAGSSTPVQAAAAHVVRDPERRPWVSTHLRPDRWAVETNAGYPGTMLRWLGDVTGTGPAQLWERAGASRPGAGGVTAVVASPCWSEAAWATKAPNTVVGLRPTTTDADLARAFVEAHAFAIRANLADLEAALGRPAAAVVVTGGAAAEPAFPALLAEVLGRDLVVPAAAQPAALAGAALVARATGCPGAEPAVATRTIPAGDPAPYADAYQRFLDAHAALRAHLPEDDAHEGAGVRAPA
ncbi:MAG: FGGY family carbohydrate kinase, partial [Acidimicrobiales bacterium]